MKKASEIMEFTGERFVPEVRGNIELEHLHRYLLACKVAAGKTVLDIASGEGYGSAMLARTAHKVTGVDISQESISHAQEKYQAENLAFRLGSCSAIPLGDASVDVVVSFETIEHHDEHEAMMREIKRVLRPGGVLVISSPDKLEYSDKPSYSNPHHVKELYRDEFKKLLDLYFKNHSIYGQRVVYGSAIFCEDGACPVESYELVDDALPAIPGVSHAVYLVAVASDAELPLLGSGVLEQPINETDLVQGWVGVVAERDGQITNLNQVVAERDREIEAYREQAERIVAELHDARTRISHLNQTAAERSGQIVNLDQAVAARDGQIANLDQVVAERDRQITNLNHVLTERDREIEAYREQAERIVAELHDVRMRISHVNQTAVARDGQIANLNQVVAERDREIEAYREQAERIVAQLHEANTRISDLNRDLAERDRQIARLSQEVTEYVQREVDAGESMLPDGFDPDVYVKLNPDVAAAGLDPKTHYLRHGRREGRLYKLSATDVCGDDGAEEGQTNWRAKP